MNRILASLLFVVAVSLTPVFAQTVVPAEMERLRVSYEAARERATRPLDEKYMTELTKLQGTYTKASKLEEAVIVANEIQRMKERLGLTKTPPGPGLTVPVVASTTPSGGNNAGSAGTGGVDATVVIPANSPSGYRIGGVKRGDTLTLQYVSGVWKSKGGIATENPDNPKATYGEDDRLVIAEAPDATGKAGEVIKVVPPDTATKAFVYAFQTTRNDVVLRIHNNSERKENPGTVSYKMKLVR